VTGRAGSTCGNAAPRHRPESGPRWSSYAKRGEHRVPVRPLCARPTADRQLDDSAAALGRSRPLKRVADAAAGADVPRWLNEWAVAELSGLPGPLVAELLPCLPTLQDYCAHNELYDADSVYKARMAVLMMRCGIRMSYIRAAMAEPVAREDMAWCSRQWEALDRRRNGSTWLCSRNRRIVAVVIALLTTVALVGAVMSL
jgi:hypothetical protein